MTEEHPPSAWDEDIRAKKQAIAERVVTTPPGGERYEALVPDTLDLAQRAELALNGLGGTIDPDGDYLMWVEVYCNSRPPFMLHGGSDTSCTPKFAVSLPLMRVACGSDKYLDVEQGMMDTLVGWQSQDDGLYYSVYSAKRPWHMRWHAWKGYDTRAEDAAPVLSVGAMMLAMMIRQQMDGDPGWEPKLRAMARGLQSIAVDKGDYAYYPDGGIEMAFTYPRSGWISTDEPTSETEGGEQSVLCYQGYQLRALSQWAARTGDEQALEFAGKLARFIMKPKFWGGVSDPILCNGAERGHVNSHFHARSISLRGLLEYGVVAGDPQACEFVRSSYEYMRSFAIPETGFIPVFIPFTFEGKPCPPTESDYYHYMEGCFLGDLVAMAVKLSQSGLGDYWEDVDRLVRNQYAEAQFADRSLLERVLANSPQRAPGSDYTDRARDRRHPIEQALGREYAEDDVLDRALGIFPVSIGMTSVDSVWSLQCCTGNATSGIYYAWDAITTYEGDHAQVNLFLNRAAPWLDIDSYLPYEGRVVITNKTAARISVRIPPWVSRARLECRLNGDLRRPSWVASYAVFDGVKPTDTLELRFPVAEQTVTRTAYSGKPDETVYTIHSRANTVLGISPRDESPRSYPFYLRDHMKGDVAPMKKVTRYVAPIIPTW